MSTPSLKTLVAGILFALYFLLLQSAAAVAQSPDHQIHVATTGENSASCGSAQLPCRTIQHAVNRAGNDQWVRILVAAGVYQDDAGDPNPCEELQIDAVVCIINRRVELIGGFSVQNWSESNPAANPTTIDGEGQRRGVTVLNVSSAQNRIDMSGFTIRRGRAGGIPRLGGDAAIFGFGGGMLVDVADGSVKEMIFANNVVVGDDRSSSYGGAASGGGLAVRGVPSEFTLESVTFTNNRAEGGNGGDRGGYAIGGGFYSYDSRVRGNDIVAEDNVAQAGQANGSGVAGGGSMSDAQGGGLAFQQGSDVVFENIQVFNNSAIGGPAPGGNGGGAFGGGIFAEFATHVVIRDALVRGNLAQGGDGINNDAPNIGAGYGSGGGMRLSKSPATLERVTIIENRAQGGAGERFRGGPGGGGLVLTSFTNHQVSLINTVIADNHADMGSGSDLSVGGGGGGLWVQGANVTIDHSTIAGNRLEPGTSLYGPAILLVSTAAPPFEVSLKNSIVAGHQFSPDKPAIQMQSNTTLRLDNVIFSENAGDNNVGGGTTIGLDTTRTVPSVGFIAPGSPKYDYRILSTSPAVNAAPGSDLSTDRDNRKRDERPDIGAYEWQPSDATAQPFDVAVTAAAKDRLRVHWNHDPVIASYRMTITCARGANPPAETGCDIPLNISGTTTYDLTELTPYAPYTVSLAALNEEGAVVIASNPVSAFPTDYFVFAPMILR